MKTIWIAILMAHVIKGYCNESNEETRRGVEYMQIFRNIPTLFEYFLDELEQRVEILEKNDLAPFQTNSENFCDTESSKQETKRETCSAKTREFNNKNQYDSNIYKRSNSDEQMDDSYTTEVHEYGRSNSQYSNQNKKGLDYSIGTLNNFQKREIIKRKLIDKPFDRHLVDVNVYNVKNIKNKKKKIKKEIGKQFTGIDWSLVYLSPEEVEERAIQIEQLIEDHNNKEKEN